MLREHITAGDRIGQEAQGQIKEGKLVPDEVVNLLVTERLKSPDCRAGLILDGYPRTVNQAKVLLALMENDGFRTSVVHLVVNYEKIVARLSGRRQCPVCGTLYSLTTNPTRVAGICDREGGTLVTREDDRETVIRERLHEYDVQTVPILNFFRESGVPLFEVDAGEATPEQVRQSVCRQLLEAGVLRAAADLK
jgi:adenylate kinase